MGHAYKRLKQQDSDSARKWLTAMQTLRRGDHYILVLAGHPLKHTSMRERLACGFLFAVILSPVIFLFLLAPGRKSPTIVLPFASNPHVLQILFVALIPTGIFFPRFLLKPFDWILNVFEKLLGTEEK